MDRITPALPILADRLTDEDPRLTLDGGALALASHNAFPIVANRARAKAKGGLVAGGTIALFLGGLTFWSMSVSRQTAAAPPAPVQTVPQPAPIQPIPLTPVGEPAIVRPTAPPMAATAPAVDHAHSPVMVYDMSVAPAPAIALAAPPAGSPAAKAIPGTLGDIEAFAARLGGTEVETASATRMANPQTTISQGTLIAAVLETAVDSDLPGYVRAVVAQDVKSFDGSRVLIPRSSRLIGQYKSGLAAGQTRAYVMWTRLLRPDGVSVAIASPGVDYAGASGLAGKVDGHFMKRFGSAMLLSVVGGLGALGSGGTSVVLSSGGSSAASVAAQRDAQIPPTIRIRQGEPIRIFTARDLDFSTVEAAQ